MSCTVTHYVRGALLQDACFVDLLSDCPSFIGLLLLLKWLCSPMRTFASLMHFSQLSLYLFFFYDLTVPRPHLRFPNYWLFLRWGRQPHAQLPTWRIRSPYLYPLETGWPSYTPRHRVPILVAFYDMRGLRWDYSYSRSPHRDTFIGQ
jgi:hypothetical protein